VLLAYLGMSSWSENYAFRIRIIRWLLADPALLVPLLALLTVGFQALRAARSNRVVSLRSQ